MRQFYVLLMMLVPYPIQAQDLPTSCKSSLIMEMNRSVYPDDHPLAAIHDLCNDGKKIVCLDMVTAASDLYQKMYQDWTAPSESGLPMLYSSDGTAERYNTNLQANFEDLLTKHEQAFLIIQTDFLGQLGRIDRVSDQAQFKKSMREITDTAAATRKKLAELEKLNRKFIRMMNHEESLIQKVLGRVEPMVSSDNCAFLADEVTTLQEHGNAWRDEMAKLRAYIVNSSPKKQLLVDHIVSTSRNLVMAKFLNSIGQNYKELRREMADALTLIDISIELDVWWHEATLNGLASRLHTRHKLRTVPLMILNSHKDRLAHYKSRLLLINTNHRSKQLILDKIAGHEALIDRNIAYVKPWDELLEKQLRTENRRITIIDRYVPTCKPLVEQFLAQAESVSSQELFMKLETLYQRLSTTCKRKRRAS